MSKQLRDIMCICVHVSYDVRVAVPSSGTSRTCILASAGQGQNVSMGQRGVSNELCL